MQTAHVPARRARLPLVDRAAVIHAGTAPYRLSAQLAVVAVLASLPTLLRPSLLSGPDVMIGSARGTALVLVVLTVPLLLWSAHATSRGSARGLVLWLGALAHLAYQGVMFCFATPLNSLFLLYVAMLGLSAWTAAVILTRIDVRALHSRWGRRSPVRVVAGVLGTVAVLNALLWISRILPTIGEEEPSAIMDGSGLTTNPVIVQDLALWLPLGIVAAVLLWKRTAVGHLAAGVALVTWTLEGATVATDQWFGHRADPSTEWATTGAVWLFVGLTAVTLVPAFLHLHALDRHHH